MKDINNTERILIIMVESSCKSYVSAGDLEKFSYCPMSWKLAQGDAKEKDLQKGVIQHKKISENLEGILIKEKSQRNYEMNIKIFATVATLAAIIALLMLPELSNIVVGAIFGGVSVLWLLFAFYFLYRSINVASHRDRSYFEKWVLGLAMAASVVAVFALTYEYFDEQLFRILLVIALLWLLMASFFLHSHLETTREVRTLREGRRLGTEIITYVDDLDNAPLLVSERFCLRGRPDYIIFQDRENIPVEEKTGKTPKGPYFSHIMQMAAYIVLVNDNMGNCHRGRIKYKTTDFEIVLDSKTRKTFFEIRDRIDDCERTGEVHRNHNREGKCRGCSRKEDCPESLA